MDSFSDWEKLFDASDSSNENDRKSVSQKSTSVSSVEDLTRPSATAKADASVLNSIVPEEAKYEVQASTVAKVEANIKQDAIRSNTPLTKDDEQPDAVIESIPHCTGCKSSSPAVANCFSCTALLCASCVIAHQLMVAFEGHHVTNLGQGSFANKDVDLTTAYVNIEAIRKMVNSRT